MHFSSLQGRLVSHLRSRVRSGELTERGAARLTGVSQPHLHNVLKGARLLSTEMADQVLRGLNLCVFDLIEAEEFREYERRAGARHGIIPRLWGRLGPRYPFPAAEAFTDSFPSVALDLTEDPALVELAGDPLMSPLFRDGDLAVIDRAAGQRRKPVSHCYYALEIRGEGLVRRLRLLDGQLLVIPCADGAPADPVSIADRNILEIVKAKVVWIGRNLELPSHCTKID